MNEDKAPAKRPLPALDKENCAYWTGGGDGRLMIVRCLDCRTYVHPPRPRCPSCGGGELAPEAVSGRGRVKTFTVNRQAWMPGLGQPYVIAAIELEEQPELYVIANIVDCPVDAVSMRMPVEVLFEQHEDVFLPLFRPAKRTGS